MRFFRNGLIAVMGVALMAVLVGCGGNTGTPENGDNPAKRLTILPSLKRTLKPAKDLRVPEGVEVTESKMAKSFWSSYDNSRVGDVAEYEFPGASMKTRMEVFDLADRAVVVVTEGTMEIEGKVTKTRSGMRMLFTEPEPAAEAKDDKITVVKRSDRREFTVGGRVIYSDTLIESVMAGKVVGRSWSARELPSAVLEMQDGEGKITMRLAAYQRGR